MEWVPIIRRILPIAFCVLFITMSGCTSGGAGYVPNATAPTAASPTVSQAIAGNGFALTVKGNVDRPMQYTVSELKARPHVNETVDFKDNVTADLTGILLNDLLNDSMVRGNATSVTFSSNDGYVKTLALSDIRASPDSLIILGRQLPPCCPSEGETNETLKNVIPGQPYSTWVGKLVTIEVE